ncbi:unnamed protein product [Agarophyton chilense]|eukprot:gb/GEZJ01003091.1/.p1 GENE.gb/GEZJ01003091.1/~~gb/GEZJ01003091.1/.p1  ORF type:complete len:360 (-),score=52.09 gb/GEZJ01003091.1/:380-1459(-)
MKLIELFLSASISAKHSDTEAPTFAVVLRRDAFGTEFEELGRTETIAQSDPLLFFTSFTVSYNERLADETVLRFELYERKTDDTEKLREHDHLAKATLSLPDLILAPGNHLTTQLSHPTIEEKVGVLTISAEEVDASNQENQSDVLFDLSSNVLRKKDWNKTLLHQRYELKRAHKHEDTEGHTVWLPIHKSDRIGKQRYSNTIIEFSTTNLKYRHLCNGDDERRLKISLYVNSPTIKRTTTESLLGSVQFCLRDICELDPTQEVLPLEGGGDGDEDVGHVSILKAEPTDYGSHFALRVNFEHQKYSTGGSQEKRKLVNMTKKRLSMSKLSIGRGKSSQNGPKLPALNSIENLFKQQPTR